MRRALLIVDWFLTILFAMSMVGLIFVLLGLSNDLNVLIFFVVLGVPYGLLRFVVLGSPVPFTRLPSDQT